MFALFFLGGFLPAMGRFILRRGAEQRARRRSVHDIFETYLKNEYHNDAIAKYLADSPPLLYFLFEGTLMFLPLLVLLVGFDQIAGEIQHRTIRYSAGRAIAPLDRVGQGARHLGRDRGDGLRAPRHGLGDRPHPGRAALGRRRLLGRAVAGSTRLLRGARTSASPR